MLKSSKNSYHTNSYNMNKLSFITGILCLLILSSCGMSYDRDDFNFQSFMEDNGDDIAEYLQNNWEIDSAMVMHVGFFKARDWKQIYPEEMQTIFVGEDRYNESEYLEEKGFDVNAPLFVVYFSKLSMIQGNSYDDAGVNPGSLLTEYSEEGIDAAHDNYEGANYKYDDRLYYMAYATIVDGQFKLLMCCDSENYNDEIAFPLYYDLVGKNNKFYEYSMGGGNIKSFKHKDGKGKVYSSARVDFAKFIKNQNIALFTPTSKRSNSKSEFELSYKGCAKPSMQISKSLDYFFMLYNGDMVRSEIEGEIADNRAKINDKIRELIGRSAIYCSSFNDNFSEKSEDTEFMKLFYENDSLTDRQNKEILNHFQKNINVVQIAERLEKKLNLISENEPRMSSEKYSAIVEIRQSLRRGYFIGNTNDVQFESLGDYQKRLEELELNIENTIKSLMAKMM